MKRGMITLSNEELRLLQQLLVDEKRAEAVYRKCGYALSEDPVLQVSLELNEEEVATVLDCFVPELLKNERYRTIYIKLRSF